MASLMKDNPSDKVSCSDDYSDEENLENFVSYKDRPEWSDVVPTPQDDGDYSVVNIKYSSVFSETFSYFRTIVNNNEISKRAFALTTDCIMLNASNYTIWHYRRLLIDKLNLDLVKELRYIENIIINDSKNYQVWEHYKRIFKSIKEKVDNNEIDVNLDKLISNVKKFIHKVIDLDSKNYHCWQHLQWLINDWNKWEDELDYSAKLIELDIRNNSAWNHRFFVIERTTNLDIDTVQSECAFTLSKIDIAPHNESAWNYLSGLLRRSKLDFDDCPNLIDHCKQLYGDRKARSSHLMAFLITYYCHKMDCLKKIEEANRDNEKYLEYFTEAIDLCSDLETSIDTLRNKYWQYRLNVIRKTYSITN